MEKPTFKILSIDGGGIRGVIPGMFLDEIERRMGQPISRLFDLIAGTSTGGILACGLALPGPGGWPKYQAAQLIELYEKEGGRIFEKPAWPLFHKFKSLFATSYPYKGIETVLSEYYGEASIQDALTEILITAYDIELRKPVYFKSRLAREQESAARENFRFCDVARATSAAPTYFDPKEVFAPDQERFALVDGGVYANNPSVLAYAEATELLKSRGQRAIDDLATAEAGIPFFMLSLGTGANLTPYPCAQVQKWGAASWIRPIIDILMQGVSESVHYEMRYLLPDNLDGTPRYVRFDPTLPKGLDEMDNASQENIQALKDLAKKEIEQHSAQIDLVCELLS